MLPACAGIVNYADSLWRRPTSSASMLIPFSFFCFPDLTFYFVKKLIPCFSVNQRGFCPFFGVFPQMGHSQLANPYWTKHFNPFLRS